MSAVNVWKNMLYIELLKYGYLLQKIAVDDCLFCQALLKIFKKAVPIVIREQNEKRHRWGVGERNGNVLSTEKYSSELLLLLLLLLLLSSVYPLCRVSTLIFLRQTMSLGTH